ncbi:AAEL003816-PA [Aedes aegypti]|uniref:AAEL003816-PA n=1 Tax=Aedes aegypti TaxID=7159 RepID=Q17ED7_AEDAE|nr:AAEL003816-PA [Aedes aegypti]
MHSLKLVSVWLIVLLSAILALAQGFPQVEQRQRFTDGNDKLVLPEEQSLESQRSHWRSKRTLCTGKFSKILIQPCFFHCQTFGMKGKCSEDRKCNCVPF